MHGMLPDAGGGTLTRPRPNPWRNHRRWSRMLRRAVKCLDRCTVLRHAVPRCACRC